MKFDNHAILVSTAKMLQNQEDNENSAPFVIVVGHKDEQNGKEGFTNCVHARGGDFINLTQSLVCSLVESFKNSGMELEQTEEIVMKIALCALERNYGMGAMLEHALNKMKGMVTNDEDEEEEE